jgi:hypothetical protein
MSSSSKAHASLLAILGSYMTYKPTVDMHGSAHCLKMRRVDRLDEFKDSQRR